MYCAIQPSRKRLRRPSAIALPSLFTYAQRQIPCKIDVYSGARILVLLWACATSNQLTVESELYRTVNQSDKAQFLL